MLPCLAEQELGFKCHGGCLFSCLCSSSPPTPTTAPCAEQSSHQPGAGLPTGETGPWGDSGAPHPQLPFDAAPHLAQLHASHYVSSLLRDFQAWEGSESRACGEDRCTPAGRALQSGPRPGRCDAMRWAVLEPSRAWSGRRGGAGAAAMEIEVGVVGGVPKGSPGAGGPGAGPEPGPIPPAVRRGCPSGVTVKPR